MPPLSPAAAAGQLKSQACPCGKFGVRPWQRAKRCTAFVEPVPQSGGGSPTWDGACRSPAYLARLMGLRTGSTGQVLCAVTGDGVQVAQVVAVPGL